MVHVCSLFDVHRKKSCNPHFDTTVIARCGRAGSGREEGDALKARSFIFGRRRITVHLAHDMFCNELDKPSKLLMEKDGEESAGSLSCGGCVR